MTISDESKGPRVFISYRRSDRALAAHWVHREVAARFGKEAVFFDVDGIPAGFDYREFLQERVTDCDVLLAVIGDDWLDVQDENGRRRLDSDNDFVRIEIETALKRKIPIIPVLVENAPMPKGRDLPTSLHELAYRQALEVRSGPYVDDHFRRLTEGIENAWRIHTERRRRTEAAEENVAEHVEDTPRRSARKKKRTSGKQGLSVETPWAADKTPGKSEAASAGNEITNDIGMKLVAIPAGQFTMGSPETEIGRRENEGPMHDVELTRGFYLGVCPVTQDQYTKVVGSNHSHFTDDGRRPVEMVTWFDAVNFCNQLSEHERLEPFYALDKDHVEVVGGDGYRLPTEAEWEYACRAGTTTPWWFGEDKSRLGEFAWYGENSDQTTHPAGEKPANAWGLHDMHGNVWEWCWDWYGKYTSSHATDPAGPESGTGRVLRGGSWDDDQHDCRSAVRILDLPESRNFNVGFRAARTL